MGCCQSDLKGEKQTDLTGDAPQPVKKVATNFSTIDYDAKATGRRETVVAPHEAERQKSTAGNSVRTDDDQIAPVSRSGPAPEASSSGGERIGAENKLAVNLTQDPVTRNQEAHSLEPYRDVTASPTTQIKESPIDQQVASSLSKDSVEQKKA